jgi:hypothetical protein
MDRSDRAALGYLALIAALACVAAGALFKLGWSLF